MIILNDLKFLIPEIFLIVSILFLLIYGIFYSNRLYFKYINLTKPLIFLSIWSLVIYSLLNLNNVSNLNIISNYLFINDNFIIFLKLYFTFMVIVLLSISYNYMNFKKIKEFEFFILVLLIVLGIILVVMSYDFISAFISIELQTLCFYIIIATSKTNKTLEASIKYYILGSFSTAVLLLGISLIYFSTGMTNFKDLSDLLLITDNIELINLSYIGFIFISIAFFFKLSLAPFHFWLIDVFEGSLRIVLAIFSNLSKLSLLILFYKIYILCLIRVQFDWQFFFLIIIILSWLFGSIGGLTAKKMNKLIAYSSINHMGFFFFALILNNFYGLFIYFIFYSINLLFLFVFLMSLLQENNKDELFNLSQFMYFKKINYIGSLSLTVCFLSIAGIPPLSGFFGKYFIILWSLNHYYYLIALFSLLVSIISCFYYLRVTKIVNFDNNNKWIFLKTIPTTNCYIIISCLFFNIFFLIFLPFLTLLSEYFFYSSFF